MYGVTHGSSNTALPENWIVELVIEGGGKEPTNHSDDRLQRLYEKAVHTAPEGSRFISATFQKNPKKGISQILFRFEMPQKNNTSKSFYMPYTPIIGTLGYVLSKDKKSVLQVFRSFNKDDDHLGKYNGLGGKLEKGEDVYSGMLREIQEEAGIIPLNLELRGTINWTGFGKKGEDWLGFIFLIHDYEGKVFEESPEGPLSWHKIETLSSLPIWEGDKYFLPLVFDKNPIPFHGIMPYKNHKPISWNYFR